MCVCVCVGLVMDHTLSAHDHAVRRGMFPHWCVRLTLTSPVGVVKIELQKGLNMIPGCVSARVAERENEFSNLASSSDVIPI